MGLDGIKSCEFSACASERTFWYLILRPDRCEYVAVYESAFMGILQMYPIFCLRCSCTAILHASCTFRISINLHQLHKASLIAITLRLSSFADVECGLNVDLIRAPQRVVLTALRPTRGAVCPRLFGRDLVGATHNLGEESRKAETNCGHANADNADLAFDYRPKRCVKVIPGHVCSFGKVHERSETQYRYDGDTGYVSWSVYHLFQHHPLTKLQH